MHINSMHLYGNVGNNGAEDCANHGNRHSCKVK